jgi:5'-nucleotidase
LFSGDAFSPSILSTIKEGYQMLHCLNQLGIDAACYGNHEFDYPHEHLIDLKNKSNFPWLLGNLTYLPTGQNLGEGK